MTDRGSVLIVSLNNKSLTKLSVNSALAQDIESDVLVLDNGSSDGSIEWLRTKPIALIANPKQLSLSACWNIGLRTFWKMGRTHCLVLNNDLWLREDYYRLLLEMNKPFVTGVSVDDRDRTGTAGDRTAEDLLSGARKHPDFSAFCIRKEVTDKIGWFNESYPCYGEDAEWHIRMFRAGIWAGCVDLPYYHAGASTLKYASPGEQARIRRGADIGRSLFRKQYGCLPGSPEYEALFS